MRSDEELLSDILGSIERIEHYGKLGRARFDADELIQTFIVHQLVLIGEAANRLSETMRERIGSVRWQPIIAMRNHLVHGYFQVDHSEVWKTVEVDLPVLRQAIADFLK